MLLKILICLFFLVLLGLTTVAFNFAYSNFTYTDRKYRTVTGHYNNLYIDGRRSTQYVIDLRYEANTYFISSITKWSFDAEKFEKTVTYGDLIILTIEDIPVDQSKEIEVFQIQHKDQKFIDEEKFRSLRRHNGIMAALMGLFFALVSWYFYRPRKKYPRNFKI